MLNWIVLNRTDYLYKMDLALNNLQRLICHKTQQPKPNHVKLVDKSIYLISNISSTESDVNVQISRAWSDKDRKTIIWKSYLYVEK